MKEYVKTFKFGLMILLFNILYYHISRADSAECFRCSHLRYDYDKCVSRSRQDTGGTEVCDNLYQEYRSCRASCDMGSPYPKKNPIENVIENVIEERDNDDDDDDDD